MRDLQRASTDFGHFWHELLASSLGAMAGSVFVSDERPLAVSIGVAQPRLADLVQGDRLAGASHVAYQGGIDQLVRVGPFGDLPGASRLVRVQFVDPVYRDDAMTVGMRWEAAGVTGGLFPVLDANIRVSDDGQRSQLGLTACYRLPFGAVGAGLDRLLLHKVATATIHAFLARVASALEATHEAAAETATSSWWPPAPEPAPNTGS
ncbi:MAG TPA: hypothetical protein VIV12_08280 [Streptosporangiaceae bacterium]